MKLLNIFSIIAVALATRSIAAPLPADSSIGDSLDISVSAAVDRRAPAPVEWDSAPGAITALGKVKVLFEENRITPELNKRYVFVIKKALQGPLATAKLSDVDKIVDKEPIPADLKSDAAKQKHKDAKKAMYKLQINLKYEHASVIVVGLKQISKKGKGKTMVQKWILDDTNTKKLDFFGGPEGLNGGNNNFSERMLKLEGSMIGGTKEYRGWTTKTMTDILPGYSNLAQTKKYKIAPNSAIQGSVYCGSIAEDLSSEMQLLREFRLNVLSKVEPLLGRKWKRLHKHDVCLLLPFRGPPGSPLTNTSIIYPGRFNRIKSAQGKVLKIEWNGSGREARSTKTASRANSTFKTRPQDTTIKMIKERQDMT
ncbi:hypothetical protein BJ508DRAFT_314297 [Ascobolus immersus RN42]|uniref:Uncharacterized protein n=1 Tax=Ascobolus immersus RN42 TaxID=1160509 RepID=A0A3N4HFK7_ASCIM|nr:hypothetical protein BJ508DRAFT_314297 [Ascobolus immersus RN42]